MPAIFPRPYMGPMTPQLGTPQRVAELAMLERMRRWADSYLDYVKAVDLHREAGLINPLDDWPLVPFARVKPAASAFTEAVQLDTRGRHLAVQRIVEIIEALPAA